VLLNGLDSFLALKHDCLPIDSGKVKVPATTALGGSGAAKDLPAILESVSCSYISCEGFLNDDTKSGWRSS
jgi:hypothetical protein